MTITTRSAATLAVAMVLASCGGADPAPTPTGAPADATAGTAPTDAATPRPTATADATTTATADPRTPEGWERVVLADRGFSLAIPPDWEVLSAEQVGDSGAMDELLEANPDAAVAIEQGQAALASGQIALFAFDASGESIESGFATNLNAIPVGPVEGTAGDATTEIAEAIEQQIPVLGEIETSTVRLPAGDAALVRYEWEVDDGEGATTPVTVTQYAIIGAASGNGYILSLSAASGRIADYEEVFRQIAESFAEETS